MSVKTFSSFFILLLLYPTIGEAQSCWKLYEARAKKVADRAPEIRVGEGFQLHPFTQELTYDTGFVVGHEKVRNFADDLISAIRPGYLKDSSRNLLEEVSKFIHESCAVSQTQTRLILSALMEDGTLCPNGQVLRPKLLVSDKKQLKKIVKSEVDSGRFSEVCQGPGVVNDSSRKRKDIEGRGDIASPAGPAGSYQ